MSRPMTKQECRDRFLSEIREYARYWESLGGQSTRERLDGLAFSVLALLDGESAGLPGFTVIPCPHPGNRDYYMGKGEDYWPDDVDISVCLHEEFFKD